MHEVLVNRLGGLSLPRKSVVRLTDRPNMTLDVYRGRKTTMQQRKAVCTRTPFTVEKILPRAGIELGTARPALNPLSYRGFSKETQVVPSLVFQLKRT